MNLISSFLAGRCWTGTLSHSEGIGLVGHSVAFWEKMENLRDARRVFFVVCMSTERDKCSIACGKLYSSLSSLSAPEHSSSYMAVGIACRLPT